LVTQAYWNRHDANGVVWAAGDEEVRCRIETKGRWGELMGFEDRE
jgi:hypothetical protein